MNEHDYTYQEIAEARVAAECKEPNYWVDKKHGAGVAHSSGAGDQSFAQDPLKHQVGGDWYTRLAIQPAEYATANKMTFLEGLILKYISRWRNKDGFKDLRKIKQCVDLIIKLEVIDPTFHKE